MKRAPIAVRAVGFGAAGLLALGACGGDDGNPFDLDNAQVSVATPTTLTATTPAPVTVTTVAGEVTALPATVATTAGAAPVTAAEPPTEDDDAANDDQPSGEDPSSMSREDQVEALGDALGQAGLDVTDEQAACVIDEFAARGIGPETAIDPSQFEALMGVYQECGINLPSG